VEALARQDGYFSVTDLAPGEATTRVVGSVVEALHATDDSERVLDLLADAELGVVTLTITEKGYDPNGIAIRRLTDGLARRARTHRAPITVITCDNMAGNGRFLSATVRQAVERSDWTDKDQIAAWIERSVAFPATVVDRIVPAPTLADKERAAAALGFWDEAAVVGEPYTQWIIEDAFATKLPRWDLAGAIYVPDVEPYQLTKLRLLNGAHSALAYLGLAAGYDTVAAVMDSPWGAALVRDLSAETAPTIPAGGPDAAEYAEALVRRFSNPAMAHALRQIGSDGSEKLPYRLLDPMRILLREGLSASLHELALAAWAVATQLTPQGQQRFGTTDPRAAKLGTSWGAASTPEVVAALLDQVGFGDLARDGALAQRVAQLIRPVAGGDVEAALAHLN
jgi:fructuronate reductase